jgi:hypothetical protein
MSTYSQAGILFLLFEALVYCLCCINREFIMIKQTKKEAEERNGKNNMKGGGKTGSFI